jgi:hypothetical protein
MFNICPVFLWLLCQKKAKVLLLALFFCGHCTKFLKVADQCEAAKREHWLSYTVPF